MKEAYKYHVEFGRSGRCVRRTVEIGPAVPWAVITIVIAITGKDIPPTLWSFLQAIAK